MNKFVGLLLLLAGLLISVPVIGKVKRDSEARPHPEALEGEQISFLGDSLNVVGRWRPVSNSTTHDTVGSYRWRIFTGKAPKRVEIRRGTILTDTTVLVDGRIVLRERFASPLVNDTVFYSFSLRAVDRRGIPSPEVYSGYLRVIGEVGPPLPPVIEMDTVVGTQPDSIQIVNIFGKVFGDTIRLCLPWDTTGWIRQPGDTTTIGQCTISRSVQLCVLVWRGNRPFMAKDQPVDCYLDVVLPRDPGI